LDAEQKLCDQRKSFTDRQLEDSTVPSSGITVDAVQVAIAENMRRKTQAPQDGERDVGWSPRVSSTPLADDCQSDLDSCIDARELAAMKKAAMRNRGDQAVQNLDLPGQEFSASFLELLGSASSLELGDGGNESGTRAEEGGTKGKLNDTSKAK
jgi:hypothetical protein